MEVGRTMAGKGWKNGRGSTVSSALLSGVGYY